MPSGQTPLVTLTIGSDVLGMSGPELLKSLNDHGESTGLAHGLGGEVGVATCACHKQISPSRLTSNHLLSQIKHTGLVQ